MSAAAADGAEYAETICGDLTEPNSVRVLSEFRAVIRDHFRSLLRVSMLTSEERAVIRAKLDRLEWGRPGRSAQPPDLTGLAVHQGLSIALVPVNETPALVSLPSLGRQTCE